MRGGVESERQLQHVLEIIGDHHVAAAVRQAVGKPGHQCRGDNDEQAEADPGADERRQRPRRAAGRQRARQAVDDTAEQDRLDELRYRQRDVGERQRHRKASLGRQQSQDAEIKPQERHRPTFQRRCACQTTNREPGGRRKRAAGRWRASPNT